MLRTVGAWNEKIDCASPPTTVMRRGGRPNSSAEAYLDAVPAVSVAVGIAGGSRGCLSEEAAEIDTPQRGVSIPKSHLRSGKTLKSKRTFCSFGMSLRVRPRVKQLGLDIAPASGSTLEKKKQESSRKGRSTSEPPKHRVFGETRSAPLAWWSAWQSSRFP
jgi:hypothetical protein